MFPTEVIRVDIKPITFNERQINEVFIDLEHINKGKEKKRSAPLFRFKMCVINFFIK